MYKSETRQLARRISQRQLLVFEAVALLLSYMWAPTGKRLSIIAGTRIDFMYEEGTLLI